ncbi:MAG: Rieske 2Fe-2S domain-containing protein [Acidiferrobacteraceae bacterium]
MDAVGSFLCNADRLVDGGPGIRFRVRSENRVIPAFVIRFQGKVYAYLNQCAHQSVELDWQPGQFFDPDRNFLICATHGALYDPDTGACRTGRCAGRGLTPLPVEEHQGSILLAGGPIGVHLVDTELPEDGSRA